MAAPGQISLADLTYVSRGEGWLYRSGILVTHAHAHGLVGWSIRDVLQSQIVLEALTIAVERQKPPPRLADHSDRGIRDATATYGSSLTRLGITLSFSRKADCRDFALMEGFLHTLKTEPAWEMPRWGANQRSHIAAVKMTQAAFRSSSACYGTLTI